MITGDKNPNPFLNSGDYDYIAKLQIIDTAVNKIIDELIRAQFGASDLDDYLTTNNISIADAIAAVQNAAVLKTGLVSNLNINSQILYGIPNTSGGNGGSEAVNWATAQAIFLGGGSPSSIPITSLGIGSATALQLLRINSAGNAVEGYTYSDDWNAPVSANFNVLKNSKNLCNLSSGSFTATLLASPTVGSYYRFKTYGSDTNILTIARNGCTIRRNNVNIDSVGDGNLILNGGDFVELVCIAANTYEVI
jgi:hypothetical protein